MKRSMTLFFFALLSSSIFSQPANSDINQEIGIYRSLINELYNIGYCQRFITPPFYACCNGNEHLSVEDHYACCEESNIAEEYRIYCQNCINIGELDTLTLVVETIDTLYPLEFQEYKEWILENVDSSSGFYGFVNRSVFMQEKGGFELSQLKQEVTSVTIRNKDDKRKDFTREKITAKKVHFMKKEEVKEIHKKRAFGKHGNHAILGKIGLSRIYFNKNGDKGLFYFAYLGNGNCGFEDIVLIEKKDANWAIFQKIHLGDY